jgi:alpha-galactosidase
MCLDGSISNGVRLNSCNGSDYQEWEYRWEGNDVAFLNIATRKCLDGSISEGVRLKTCNNSDYQRWY